MPTIETNTVFDQLSPRNFLASTRREDSQLKRFISLCAAATARIESNQRDLMLAIVMS